MPVSLSPGDLVRIRDQQWRVAAHTPGLDGAVLDVRGQGRENLGVRASFLLPFEHVEPIPSSPHPRRVRLHRWRRHVRAMLADATPEWHALRSPLHANITLFPFQLEPALAVTRGLGTRLLLADEVGLGKSVQAGLVIAELLHRTRHGRALVVTPASLRDQWQAELVGRFALDVWVADSASLARLDASWTGASNPWAAHAVTITSIDFVKRPEVMRSLDALVWDVMVFDEAHALVGTSDRSLAAAALACRARTVILLTATPHTGDASAFDRLCGIGDLDNAFPLLAFRRTRVDTGQGITRRTRTLRVHLSLAEREMHEALERYTRTVWSRSGTNAAARLAMIVLTRRAFSSAASLARSIERRLHLLAGEGAAPHQMALPLDDSGDLEPGAELAAPGLEDRREEREHLAHVLHLARRAQMPESKLRVLARLLDRACEPAIVFTEYRDTLARVADHLRHHSPVTLHGDMTEAERRNAIDRFTRGDAGLLVATDAGSEGLNLHHRCRLVINLELPWTPLRLEQRIGRVERIGQRRTVHAVHLLAASTAEERAVARLILRAGTAAEGVKRLRPPVTEERVAQAAMAENEAIMAAEPEVAAAGPRIVTCDLREAAWTETSRLEHLRRIVGSQETCVDPRPLLTRLRHRGNRGWLWAVRLVFTDREQQVLWDTLLGVVLSGAEAGAPSLSLPRDGLDRATASLLASLSGPRDLAGRRVEAIARHLRAERARLSARLLQPGLFDRRAERVLSLQNAVLDEALALCQIRLDEIARASQPAIEREQLAFVAHRR